MLSNERKLGYSIIKRKTETSFSKASRENTHFTDKE